MKKPNLQNNVRPQQQQQKRAQQVPISYKMLTDEGPYMKTNQPLKFDMAIYAQVTTAVKKA